MRPTATCYVSHYERIASPSEWYPTLSGPVADGPSAGRDARNNYVNPRGAAPRPFLMVVQVLCATQGAADTERRMQRI